MIFFFFFLLIVFFIQGEVDPDTVPGHTGAPDGKVFTLRLLPVNPHVARSITQKDRKIVYILP